MKPQDITTHFLRTRGVGHSRAMLTGPDHDTLVLAVNDTHAKHLQHLARSLGIQGPHRFITMLTNPDVFRGTPRPLLIDHSCLAELSFEREFQDAFSALMWMAAGVDAHLGAPGFAVQAMLEDKTKHPPRPDGPWHVHPLIMLAGGEALDKLDPRDKRHPHPPRPYNLRGHGHDQFAAMRRQS